MHQGLIEEVQTASGVFRAFLHAGNAADYLAGLVRNGEFIRVPLFEKKVHMPDAKAFIQFDHGFFQAGMLYVNPVGGSTVFNVQLIARQFQPGMGAGHK